MQTNILTSILVCRFLIKTMGDSLGKGSKKKKNNAPSLHCRLEPPRLCILNIPSPRPRQILSQRSLCFRHKGFAVALLTVLVSSSPRGCRSFHWSNRCPRPGVAVDTTPLSPGLEQPTSVPPWLCSKHTCPLTHYPEQQDVPSALRGGRRAKAGGAVARGASGSQVEGGVCPACGRSTPTSRPVCTGLHAALLAALVQSLASTKSSLLSCLLLQSLPPFVESQPERALLPSQPSL